MKVGWLNVADPAGNRQDEVLFVNLARGYAVGDGARDVLWNHRASLIDHSGLG